MGSRPLIRIIDTPDLGFRRASFCGSSGCVEVAFDGDLVALRDSKRADSPVLVFDSEEWQAFLSGVKAGEFVSRPFRR
jgi:hypothetical protein